MRMKGVSKRFWGWSEPLQVWPELCCLAKTLGNHQTLNLKATNLALADIRYIDSDNVQLLALLDFHVLLVGVAVIKDDVSSGGPLKRQVGMFGCYFINYTTDGNRCFCDGAKAANGRRGDADVDIVDTDRGRHSLKIVTVFNAKSVGHGKVNGNYDGNHGDGSD